MAKAKEDPCITYVYALYREDGVTPFYIGVGIRNRWLHHERDAWKSRDYKERIILKMRKNGCLEVPKKKLAEGLTYKAATLMERDLIQAIGRHPNGPLSNITAGGEGCLGLSRPHKPETIAKIVLANTGKKRSETVCRNFSIMRTGKKLPDYWRAGISRGLTGRVPSAETRAKIARAHAGLKRPLLSAFLLETSKPFGNPSTSGARGVTRRENGKWRVRVGIKGKRIALGDFVSFEEAIKAREEAVVRYAAELIAEAAQKTVPSGKPTLSQHPNKMPAPP